MLWGHRRIWGSVVEGNVVIRRIPVIWEKGGTVGQATDTHLHTEYVTFSNYQLNAQFFYFSTICMLH